MYDISDMLDEFEDNTSKAAASKIASGHGQDETSFTMHDLVHDVARSVMVDEVCDASIDYNTGYRYALLTVG
ncbi:hypothetical protein E2562_002010 [Oryza meyeriana var. granulata]|uniref:Uncharacterized protein n=1 Tax=Oryza meyeriana var. granulata TaxID=110450 RepID=A0A6G1C3I1_9ORYZ|nr:hypothetical protein E2562_002010 [Oryza meyeriana var. granulata]